MNTAETKDIVALVAAALTLTNALIQLARGWKERKTKGRAGTSWQLLGMIFLVCCFFVILLFDLVNSVAGLLLAFAALIVGITPLIIRLAGGERPPAGWIEDGSGGSSGNRGRPPSAR